MPISKNKEKKNARHFNRGRQNISYKIQEKRSNYGVSRKIREEYKSQVSDLVVVFSKYQENANLNTSTRITILEFQAKCFPIYRSVS